MQKKRKLFSSLIQHSDLNQFLYDDTSYIFEERKKLLWLKSHLVRLGASLRTYTEIEKESESRPLPLQKKSKDIVLRCAKQSTHRPPICNYTLAPRHVSGVCDFVMRLRFRSGQ